MKNYKMVSDADLTTILETVQVAKKMNAIIEAAYKKVGHLRDDFLSDKDFRPTITPNQIFVSDIDLFMRLFKDFDVKDRTSTDYPYKVYVVINGVTIHSAVSEEELEVARGRNKQ